jgi:RNA polymerase sigma-70 factor, ECF subfamily
VTLVARLCFNELDSAKMRREDSRGDRLPEPVDLDEGGTAHVELLDQISMAFLVVLQRLRPAERTVLLLRDVFAFDYQEIAALIGKSEPRLSKVPRARARERCRREAFVLLVVERAPALLAAFTQAARAGELDALIAMLAEDALMITDGGPEGRRAAGVRNLRAPLHGAANITAFVVATARRGNLEAEVHELNGQPAIVPYDEDEPFAALLLAVADGCIHRVYFHADAGRLRYLGPRNGRS